MRLRSIAVAGLLAGLVAGIAAAVLIPRSRAGDAAADGPVGAGVRAAAPATVRRVGAPLRSVADVRLRLLARPQVEARAADPHGGPDWAVRVFPADRVVRRALRRPGVDPVVGHDLCAQLGRLHRGRFGWLDANGTFHPMPTQNLGPDVAWCGGRHPDVGGHPALAALATITDPGAPAARITSTIAWGVAGSAARRVELRFGGRTRTPAPSAHGAFLAVSPRALDQRAVRARIRYPRGRVVSVAAGAPWGAAPTAQHVLVARAPDPNGGLPYALSAFRGRDGSWCSDTGGRVVGDAAGGVDYRLDSFSEIHSLSSAITCDGARSARERFAEHPVLLSVAGSAGMVEEGDDPARTGRIARRTQPGTTVVSGDAAPGVVSVTLETPRDVRTLTPSGPAHAVLAVYDGTFATGEVRVVARFRDGHVRAETLRLDGP